MNARCSVTILRSRNPRARTTKTHTWQPDRQRWDTQAYDAGKTFQAYATPVSDIHSLGAVIEEIRGRSDTLIIRGELKPGVMSDSVFRRYARPDDPFADVPRRWMMADIDGWAVPDGMDLVEDIDALVERAIADLLPEPFHDCTAFWQLSSSSGFKGNTLRAHVWFWLDRPIGSEPLKRFMQLNATGIDLSLFNAVQVHYTSDPVIIGGPDPIPRRTGWVQGERDYVTLPDIDLAKMGSAITARRIAASTGAGMSASQAATVDGALAEMGDGESLSGFHAPLLRAAMLYAFSTAPHARDAEALKARMRAAIERAPKAADRNVVDYLSDIYLDRNIQGAFAKVPKAGGWEVCEPEHPLPTETVEQARARMDAAIQAFLDAPRQQRLAGSVPRRGLVVSEVGLGKTEAALRAIAVFIAKAKASSEPHRVVYAIPEHALGTEVVRRALAFGIKTAAWRGRGYIFDGVPMCADNEAVDLAEQVGMSAGASVCGSPKPGDNRICSHFAACLYQQQRRPAADADLVVLAHNHLFQKLPAEVTEDLGLVVVDESFWQAGIRPRTITLETFAADAITHPVLTRDTMKRQVTDEEATNDLHVIRAKVVTALDAAPDGYLGREHVTGAGITAEDCALAKKLEWRRQRDVAMWPGMAKKARKEAHDAAAINKVIPKMAAFWTALRELLESGNSITGRIELLVESDRRGDVRVARVNERRSFCKDVLEQPTLLLDGTGDIAVVREFLHDAEVLAEARPRAPHMTVRQVIGPLSKTSLAGRPELVGELVDFIRFKAGGEPALVVCNLELEAHFQDIPGLATVHYGAMAGRDEWGCVRHVFVSGGAMPAPDDTRAMAAQLTGRAVPADAPLRSERGILMEDGSGITVEVMRYIQPDLEMIRANVADANLVQAIGRGRGVNRTAGTPLDVWVLGNVVTPYPVTTLVRWAEVALNPIERMAARGLVLFSPTDAAKVYPDLFPTKDAARMAMNRVEAGFSEHLLMEKVNKGMFAKSLSEVSYKPQGRGQQPRQALVEPGRLAGLDTFLADALGAPVNLLPPAAPAVEGECLSTDTEAELLDPGVMFPKETLLRSVVTWHEMFTIRAAKLKATAPEPAAQVVPFVQRTHPNRQPACATEQDRLFAEVLERAQRGEGAAMAAELAAMTERNMGMEPGSLAELSERSAAWAAETRGRSAA